VSRATWTRVRGKFGGNRSKESGRSGASYTRDKKNASATHFFALSPKPTERFRWKRARLSLFKPQPHLPSFIQIHLSFRDLLAKTTFQIVTIIGGSPTTRPGFLAQGQSLVDPIKLHCRVTCALAREQVRERTSTGACLGSAKLREVRLIDGCDQPTRPAHEKQKVAAPATALLIRVVIQDARSSTIVRSEPGKNSVFFQSRFSQWIHVP